MKDGQIFFINGRFKKEETLFLYRPIKGSSRPPLLGRPQVYLHRYDIDRYRVKYGAFGYNVFRSEEKFAILTVRIPCSVEVMLKHGNLVLPWAPHLRTKEPEPVVGIVLPQFLGEE